MPSKLKYIVGPRAVIRALRSRINARMGYPKNGKFRDGLDAGVLGVTSHVLDVIDHPTDATLSALEVDAIGVDALKAIRDAVRARVLAGTADAAEKALDSLSAEATLSPDWMPADPH